MAGRGRAAQPAGSLVAVATRRLTDIWRADQARRHREDLAAARESAVPAEPSSIDDSLTLLFVCCHPMLAPGSAIPLTLPAAGGLTTAEIATAFLVPEDTMARTRRQAASHHSSTSSANRNRQTGEPVAAPQLAPSPGQGPTDASACVPGLL